MPAIGGVQSTRVTRAACASAASASRPSPALITCGSRRSSSVMRRPAIALAREPRGLGVAGEDMRPGRLQRPGLPGRILRVDRPPRSAKRRPPPRFAPGRRRWPAPVRTPGPGGRRGRAPRRAGSPRWPGRPPRRPGVPAAESGRSSDAPGPTVSSSSPKSIIMWPCGGRARAEVPFRPQRDVRADRAQPLAGDDHRLVAERAAREQAAQRAGPGRDLGARPVRPGRDRPCRSR